MISYNDYQATHVAAGLVSVATVLWLARRRFHKQQDVPWRHFVDTASFGEEGAGPVLDAATGSQMEGLPLDAWISACDTALDQVLSWKPALTAPHGILISVGRLQGLSVPSYCWVQEFAEVDVEQQTTLLAIQSTMMVGNGIGNGASRQVLGAWPSIRADGAAPLVLQEFSARPLAAKRDVLHFFGWQRSETGDRKCITYGYPSVFDSWVDFWLSAHFVPRTDRIRGANLFPTCDRIVILDGGARLRVEHLITRTMGSWISDIMYHMIYRSQALQAFMEEAEQRRDRIVSLSSTIGTA